MDVRVLFRHRLPFCLRPHHKRVHWTSNTLLLLRHISEMSGIFYEMRPRERHSVRPAMLAERVVHLAGILTRGVARLTRAARVVEMVPADLLEWGRAVLVCHVAQRSPWFYTCARARLSTKRTPCWH